MLVLHTQQHILKHIKLVTVFGICYRICYALCYRLSGPLQGKVKNFFVIIIFSKCNGLICFFFLESRFFFFSIFTDTEILLDIIHLTALVTKH